MQIYGLLQLTGKQELDTDVAHRWRGGPASS